MINKCVCINEFIENGSTFSEHKIYDYEKYKILDHKPLLLSQVKSEHIVVIYGVRTSDSEYKRFSEIEFNRHFQDVKLYRNVLIDNLLNV